MPLDPTAEIMIKMCDELGLNGGPEVSAEERRAKMTAVATDPNIPKPPVHAVEDRTIPTQFAHLPVRVYRPSDADGLPLLLFFHGGGWVSGNLETHDILCRLLCDAVGCVVVSVDYRLAPEEKFPGAVNDCLGAYDWATRHAAEVGADPTNIAIAGDSAGGNLAAVVALLAHERDMQLPKLQLLVYPPTDYEFDSASMVDNATGYFLEADTMKWFYEQYLRNPDDATDRRVAPMRAASLAGLPRAVVITAEYDPLRDQGEAYGRRLQADGVPTEIVRADGLVHGFFGMHEWMPPAKESWDAAVAALRESLGVV